MYRFKSRADQEAAERLILGSARTLADVACKEAEKQMDSESPCISFCVTFAKEDFEECDPMPNLRAEVRRLREKFSLHDITVALAETMN